MSMAIQLDLFEALTEAGVKPEAARRVEKSIETAILASQEAIRVEMRTEMFEHLLTKTDGVQIENRLLKAFNENTWKIVAFVVAANSLMLAFFKVLG
jgi:hypothetical protein